MRLAWSRRAERDLLQLRAYIAQDSPRYAAQFIARLIHAVEQLPDFPRRGRVVPEVNEDSLRELIFHGYRILYRLDNDCLRIVTETLEIARDVTKKLLEAQAERHGATALTPTEESFDYPLIVK